MSRPDTGNLIELRTRETWTLPDMRGTTLRVTRGTLWVTQQDDSQDIVLRTGDSWTIERDGLTIVEAQDDARICLLGPAMAMSRPRVFALWQRMRGALAAFLTSPDRKSAPYV